MYSETIEYLDKINVIDRIIHNKLTEIEQLHAMATSITVIPKDVNVQSSGDKDRLGATVSKIVDTENEVNELVKSWLESRSEIIGTIESISEIDTDAYDVLFRKYVARKNNTQIAKEMGYATKSITRIHKRGIEKIDAILKTCL